MATLGNTPRPAYVYDTETDTWVPIGVGAHTHDYIPNTLVDAKGDILTATADNVPARLAKGADGTVLVSDSTTQTGLAWQPYAAPVTAGKNAIINGGFDFWQYSTSSSSRGYTTADRWFINNPGVAGRTFSRQTSDLTGFRYFMRMQRNNGNTATDGMAAGMSLETNESLRFAGKVVTISWYMRKGANYSGAGIRGNLYSGTGTDQNAFNSYTGATTVLTLSGTPTTSWARYSVTGTVPSNSTELAFEIVYDPTGTAGAADYLDIAGFQLEEGPVATTFSRAGGTIQGELAACQRYYVRLGGDSSYGVIGTGIMGSTTEASFVVPLPVTMRVAPTSIDFSTLRVTDFIGVNTPISSMSLTTSETTKFSARLYSSGLSGLTQYRPAFISNYNSSSGYLGFSAEL